jgi:hypothetical protein
VFGFRLIFSLGMLWSNITGSGTKQAPVAERPAALPPGRGEFAMPITPYLDGFQFDPEAKRIMTHSVQAQTSRRSLGCAQMPRQQGAPSHCLRC